jgi:hypothetical protein
MSTISEIILGLPSPGERRARRAYRELINGVRLAESQGVQLYFLTLTTWLREKSEDIEHDWRLLVKRIRRMCELVNIFFEAECFFEFVKIRTLEGRGVIHVLFKGVDISESWISKQWFKIHGAYVVRLLKCWDNQGDRLVNYLCRYLVRSSHSERLASSRNWIYPGWVRDFKKFIKTYGFKQGIKLWEQHFFDAKAYKQLCLV